MNNYNINNISLSLISTLSLTVPWYYFNIFRKFNLYDENCIVRSIIINSFFIGFGFIIFKSVALFALKLN